MKNKVKLRTLRVIHDEDFMTQAALKYPNIPAGEIVEYVKEFRNLYGDYVRIKWNDRKYDTTWDSLEIVREK